VLVPDGLSIEELDNAAAAETIMFLVGLTTTQCTEAGMAFVCARHFPSCVRVALSDGFSGACLAVGACAFGDGVHASNTERRRARMRTHQTCRHDSG